jgi:murein DD-endopeptidase MepM/ murein hydrolase activator NlpD
LLAFVCIGASLCLDAHPSSDSVPAGKFNLSNRVDVEAVKAGETPSHRFWSQLEEAIAPSATRAGKLANLQPANAAVIAPSRTGFIKPVEGYSITSAFGNRIHPIYGDLRFHEGVDIGTPSGVPVKASRAGQVIFADWNGGYGKAVIIQHEAGYETLYAHLDELLVKAGDRVSQGKVIGLTGSTGYVTGPHLHFEIRMNEIAQNPLNYL